MGSLAVYGLVGETHTRAALAGIRGLGRARHPVIATADHRSAAGLISRYAAVSAVIPDVQSAPRRYAARIGELAREHGPLMAYPVQEKGIDALYDHPSPHVHLPWPGVAAVRHVRDKRSLPRCGHLQWPHGGRLKRPHLASVVVVVDLA